jgi:4'-phosphopantetheinyl transferase
MLTWDVAPQSLALGPDEIHLWRFDVDRNLGACDDLERTLHPAELAMAHRMRSSRERTRYILRRGGLRTILACYLEASPAGFVFRYTPLGKPELESGELYFNLAHSHDVILYAFSSRYCIGVDVERVVPGVDQELSKHFLPQLVARLAALPAGERRQLFYRGWTRMEAYVKATGLGLDSDLRDFADFVSMAPVRGGRSQGPNESNDCWIYDLRPRNDYAGALAAPANCKLKCWRWLAQN